MKDLLNLLLEVCKDAPPHSAVRVIDIQVALERLNAQPAPAVEPVPALDPKASDAPPAA